MKNKTLLPIVLLFAALAAMTGAQSSPIVGDLPAVYSTSKLRVIATQNALLASLFRSAESEPAQSGNREAFERAEFYFSGRADIVNQLADALDNAEVTTGENTP